MRTLLSLAALAALIPTDATACGPVAPRVLLLASHGTDDGLGRTFARLETEVPADVQWQSLWRMSYDATAIGRAPRLATPLALTLVGTAGTRAITTTKQVFLREAWIHTTPTAAVDVGPADGFAIAVAGEHEGVAWTPLDEQQQADGALAWLAAHGVKATSVMALQLHATTKQILVVYDGDATRSVLRDGDRIVMQVPGRALGVLAADGMRFLVSDTKAGAVVRPIYEVGGL